MFEQYKVHNCSKIDDMKNISSISSCDLINGEKARPRKTFLGRGEIISPLQSKCNSKFFFVTGSKKNDFSLNIDYEDKCSHDLAYFPNSAEQEKCNRQLSTGSYPRWFKRTVRYLFSQQLRKCFNLA